MDAVSIVEPSDSAYNLAQDMAESYDVMETILIETIESGAEGEFLESGRTVCDSLGGIKGPMGRFPTSVNLASCPWGLAGAWHTHTSPTELRTPNLSLPDMSTVAYGELDVVNVTGTQTATFMVGADDPDLSRRTFNEATGLNTTSSVEVSQAILEGHVNPRSARENARDALQHLFFTVETGFDDIEHGIVEQEGIFAYGHDEYDAVEATLYMHHYNEWSHTPDSWAEEFQQRVHNCQTSLAETANGSNINVGEIVVGTAIGTAVSNVVDRIFFS